MDPVRNPYAPGAGQRPPELAGRDAELDGFDVVLERVSRGRPERSIVLTGLRGVGKTVLLNALRSAAVRRRWGTGKLEARPETALRRPLAAALHVAVRELAPPRRDEADHVLGVLKAFALKDSGAANGAAGKGSGAGGRPGLRDRWQPGIEVPAVTGRADSGDIEIDLVELLSDVGGLAGDAGRGVAVFSHEISQQGLPLVVVGAGLPHLPAVLSASKSYSERLFRYARIDRLDRAAADRALSSPAQEEGADLTEAALAAMYQATAGYPYFIQAYGKVAWDVAPHSPITPDDVRVAAPEAEAELGVGFFGSRYERATPAEREYLRAMADLEVQLDRPEVDRPEVDGPEVDGPEDGRPEVGRPAAADPDSPGPVPESGVPTSAIAELLGRRPQSLSPARDALIKKGLIYSAERGRIAFTVPHFGRYLRRQSPE
jgi:hypothetical protein